MARSALDRMSKNWIRRVGRGKTFKYVRADGRPLKQPGEIARIKKLAIPPAYTDVLVSPSSKSHLQAVGRDARGRLQYRYHAHFRARQDELKYDRCIQFARVLPALLDGIQTDFQTMVCLGRRCC